MSKPIVQCKLHTFPEHLVIGGWCFVTTFNHPNHLEGHSVVPGVPVRTSSIVSVDIEARRFETRNTIYEWEAQ